MTTNEYKAQLKSFLKDNDSDSNIKINLDVDKETFLRDSDYALSVFERN